MRLHREFYRRKALGMVIVNGRIAVAQETATAQSASSLDFRDDRERNLFGRFRANVYADGTVQAREL